MHVTIDARPVQPVNHCFTTCTGRTSRTSRVKPFTGRIRSTVLDKDAQTTDFHFANYRFPFRKVQISISQTTDFHFVSSHFVSQTTVSQMDLVDKQFSVLKKRRSKFDCLIFEMLFIKELNPFSLRN